MAKQTPGPNATLYILVLGYTEQEISFFDGFFQQLLGMDKEKVLLAVRLQQAFQTSNARWHCR